MAELNAPEIMRSAIQKVATGPEYSKDLSHDEAHDAMQVILQGLADPVQAGVLLIALRMKRETLDEYTGALQAVREMTDTAVAEVPEVLDVSDPYDGFTRGLPVSPFLPAVMAACGVPTVSHGLESIGPKYGVTHRSVLRVAGAPVDLTTHQAAARLADADIGWAYVDQAQFCPALHALADLRKRIVKRPIITTIETLVGPVRGKARTHMLAGYVHKAYPPIYAHLARFSGFHTAAIVRGVEGGLTPSLKQPAALVHYHDCGPEEVMQLDPAALGIRQETRAVPIPPELAADESGALDIAALGRAAAEAGLAALHGEAGPARDSLVYAGAIALFNLGRAEDLPAAADRVRRALDDGSALARFQAAA